MEPVVGFEPTTDGLQIRYRLARRQREHAQSPRDYNANQCFQRFCEFVVFVRVRAVQLLQSVAMKTTRHDALKKLNQFGS